MKSLHKSEKQTKCACDSPRWEGEEVRLNKSGKLVYILHCRNCKAHWKTVRPKAREYFDLSKPVNYCGRKTYGEVFAEFDRRKASDGKNG